MPHPSLLLARVGIYWVAGSQRSLPPASRSPSRQQLRRALTAPETDSSISHCILRVGAGLRRKRIPQNEGNHNSQEPLIAQNFSTRSKSAASAKARKSRSRVRRGAPLSMQLWAIKASPSRAFRRLAMLLRAVLPPVANTLALPPASALPTALRTRWQEV